MKEEKKDNNLLTPVEVCKMLHISIRTLQSYRDKRILPFIQISRKLYFKLEDIQEYLSRHYVKAAYQNQEGGLA